MLSKKISRLLMYLSKKISDSLDIPRFQIIIDSYFLPRLQTDPDFHQLIKESLTPHALIANARVKIKE